MGIYMSCVYNYMYLIWKLFLIHIKVCGDLLRIVIRKLKPFLQPPSGRIFCSGWTKAEEKGEICKKRSFVNRYHLKPCF